jgi:hypothetical protein
MVDQLTTRWIRLQRDTAETAENSLTQTITPFAEAAPAPNRVRPT